MTRPLRLLLELVSWGALAILLWVLLGGGGTLEMAGLSLRVRGVANPLTFALAAAGLARWLGPRGAADPVERVARLLARGATRAFGPRLERLGAFLRLHGDALVLGAVAAWLLLRGIAMPVNVHGDGVGYYAYVRSVLLDRDLDFENEYRDYDPRQQWLEKRTAIGRVENPFAVGSAILWAPFFALGWLGARLAALEDVPVDLSGYSAPFTFATAAGTWLLGFLGIALLYRLLGAHHSRLAALAGTLGAVLASPLAYYIPYAPFYSHTQSFFASVLFLWAWARTPVEAPAWRWTLLGLLGALVAVTRWQDAVLWGVPLLSLVAYQLRRLREGRIGDALLRPLARGIACLLGLLVGVAPQLLVFRLLNGFWLGVPQGEGFMTAWPTWLVPTLVSWYHGLYSWSPLMAVATVGLALAAWRRRPCAGGFLWGLVLVLLANGCIWQWWAGHSFGARRFASAAPLFALGLAELVRRAEPRRLAVGLVLLLIGLAILWNHALIHLWIYGDLPHGEEIDPEKTLQDGWRYLVGLRYRDLVPEGSIPGIVLGRLSSLVGERTPLVLGAFAVYWLARRRDAAPGPWPAAR